MIKSVCNKKMNEMNTAFVLLNMDLGTASTITDVLEAMPEVKCFYMVYGVYDVVIKIEADSMEQLKHIIEKKINSLNHVKSSLTMLVAE